MFRSDQVGRKHTRAGGGECICDRRARRVIGSEYLLAARIGAADAAIDLAAHGVLFVDHLSALKRNMILRRLAKELRQKRTEAM